MATTEDGHDTVGPARARLAALIAIFVEEQQPGPGTPLPASSRPVQAGVRDDCDPPGPARSRLDALVGMFTDHQPVPEPSATAHREAEPAGRALPHSDTPVRRSRP